MIKNHLHWNEDVWENPDSGMQEDLEAVQTRDVEISAVGTIAPSGLSDEQLQSYLETVSVEINGSDTLLGAQSGALKNINKELQMTGDTSARLGGVDRSLLLQGQEITSTSEAVSVQEGKLVTIVDETIPQAEQSAIDKSKIYTDAEVKKTDLNVKELFTALSGAGADATKVSQDLDRLNQQLKDKGETPAPGLIPAYIDANTRRWELQEVVDEAQNSILGTVSGQVDEINEQFLELQSSMEKDHAVSMAVPYNGSFSRSNKWADITTYSSGGTFQTNYVKFSAKGTWVGEIKYTLSLEGSKSSERYPEVRTRGISIPREDGSRTIEFNKLYVDSIDFLLTIKAGRQMKRNLKFGKKEVPRASDTIVLSEHTFTPPAEVADSYLIFFRVCWEAATYHDSYALEIIQDFNVLDRQSLTKLGPLLPGGDGRREQWIRVPSAKLQPNKPVTFTIFSTGQEPAQRTVLWSETQISWIEN